MPRRAIRIIGLFLACVAFLFAQTYKGPRPPKPDIPYLVHADRLMELESGEAKEENSKDQSVYTVHGASSSSRTPIAEPAFLIESRSTTPEQIELYRMEVRGGNREVTIAERKRKGASQPIHLTVTRVAEKLYRIEVSEPLEEGQYVLSPAGVNRVFCFDVY